ncbi:thiolase family protein, partial [Rhodococcus koreensis]
RGQNVNDRNTIAIVGVGYSEQGTLPGQTAEQNSIQAIKAALDDAQLSKDQLDGLITCKSTNGRNMEHELGPLFGVSPRFSSSLDYGTSFFSLHYAAQVLQSGTADTVCIVFGSNARSARTQGSFNVSYSSLAGAAGYMHIAGPAAMALQRYKHLYGMTDEQFGMIAVTAREWAQRNPLAVFRDPMSIDDYLAKPYMIEPLRREDITMISDGGVALILTTAERAADFPNKPVYLIDIEQDSEMRGDYFEDYLLRPYVNRAADRLWSNSRFTHSDIDLLYIQDPTAVWILQMIEAYGFAPQGEGAAWVAEGHTRPGGDLPLNTNGGQLSEGYMWGWLHLAEAVRQLRGTAEPERQTPGAEVALFCGTHSFYKGGAAILGTRAS